jgi:ribonuclease HII
MLLGTKMPYLIGTDEAGYGPNLGPLVITATVWRANDIAVESDLCEMLGFGDSDQSSSQLEFADSKRLYQPGGTLAKLERGVMASLLCLPRSRPSTWRDLLAFVDASSLCQVDELPWYANHNCSIPTDISNAEAEAVSGQLKTALERADIQLVDIRSRILLPRCFNQHIQQCGSKGLALSEWTLQLVREVMQPLDQERIFVRCDKHGGRNRYAGVLQHIFDDQLVQVLQESRADSAYQWGRGDHQVEIRFTAKGERFLPAALSSMVSKYLRELAMAAFNRFWIERIPGLRPTAGYPVDARRFLGQISQQKELLGISDDSLWRQR